MCLCLQSFVNVFRLKDIPKESTVSSESTVPESTVSESKKETCDLPRARYLLTLCDVEWAWSFISEALKDKDSGLECEPVDLGSHGKGIVVTAQHDALIKMVQPKISVHGIIISLCQWRSCMGHFILQIHFTHRQLSEQPIILNH